MKNIDYYPFGMGIPGRQYLAGNQYRYTFNGKEDFGDTGERLSSFTSGALTVLTFGTYGMKGLIGNWVVEQTIEQGFVETLSKEIFGNNSKAAVFAVYFTKFICDLKRGDLKQLADPALSSGNVTQKLADFVIDKLKTNSNIDINMPVSKDQALGESITKYLQEQSGGSTTEKQVIEKYKKKHN